MVSLKWLSSSPQTGHIGRTLQINRHWPHFFVCPISGGECVPHFALCSSLSATLDPPLKFWIKLDQLAIHNQKKYMFCCLSPPYKTIAGDRCWCPNYSITQSTQSPDRWPTYQSLGVCLHSSNRKSENWKWSKQIVESVTFVSIYIVKQKYSDSC